MLGATPAPRAPRAVRPLHLSRPVPDPLPLWGPSVCSLPLRVSSFICPSLPPSLPLFSFPFARLFLKFPVSEILCRLSFSDFRCLALNSDSNHIIANGKISLVLMGELFHCTLYRFLFIRASVSGHQGCFHHLAVIDNPAISRGVHASL